MTRRDKTRHDETRRDKTRRLVSSRHGQPPPPCMGSLCTHLSPSLIHAVMTNPRSQAGPASRSSRPCEPFKSALRAERCLPNASSRDPCTPPCTASNPPAADAPFQGPAKRVHQETGARPSRSMAETPSSTAARARAARPPGPEHQGRPGPSRGSWCWGCNELTGPTLSAPWLGFLAWPINRSEAVSNGYLGRDFAI